jgi:predicted oxidoreductase
MTAAGALHSAEALTSSTAPRAESALKAYKIPRTELLVSRIGYGSADLGSWDNNAIDAKARSKAAHAIQTAYENGVTLFDHADIYCLGKSETLFGEVLKESPGLRNKIVIQTKCGQVLPEGWQPWQPIQSNLRATHIVRSAEQSLQRLQTDYLDILLLHVPSALVRPQEVAQAFDDLHRAGKVKYFGVSNHNAAQIQLLSKTVRQPIVVNQIHLGLGNCDLLADGQEITLELVKGDFDFRPYEGVSGSGTFDYCRLHDIQVQAWTPLPPQIFKLPADAPQEVTSAVQKLKELAQAKASTPPAVALAWLLHHPAGIVPIIGSTNPEHIIADCAADRVQLSDEEWYELFAAWANIKSRAIRT